MNLNQFEKNAVKMLEASEIHALGGAITVSVRHQFWVDTCYFVEELWGDRSMSGEQKRVKVSAQLHKYFAADLEPALKIFGETFVDVAIKIAVMYVATLNPVAGVIAGSVGSVLEEELK